MNRRPVDRASGRLAEDHAVSVRCRSCTPELHRCKLRFVEDMLTDRARQMSDAAPRPAADSPERWTGRKRAPRVLRIPVAQIRPEDGLGRKRDREGHRELCRSIEQFGVLTPVTVRVAPDDSGDYLLIKGQGRTLACQMLGIEKIPAIVVDDAFAENEKVQQFLVENVARLRMRPIDRALLIARARGEGEETAEVAQRFGVSAVTVRRLEAQLDGASTREVAALKQGSLNLTLHAVIARYVEPRDRSDVVAALAQYSLSAKEMEALFVAFGWRDLVALGSDYRAERLRLLVWACSKLADMSVGGSITDRLSRLAETLPMSFDADADGRPEVAAQ
jgi:ParB/RepB/Spo0J family partition protein